MTGDGLSGLALGGGTDAKFPNHILDIAKATRSQFNYDACEAKIKNNINGPHHSCSLSLWSAVIQLDAKADAVLKKHELYQKSTQEFFQRSSDEIKEMLDELLLCGIIFIRTLSDGVRRETPSDALNYLNLEKDQEGKLCGGCPPPVFFVEQFS